jgi:hypothetical protein
MPAANALYTQSFSGNYPVLLARQMMIQSIRNIFWGKWAQFNTPGQVPVSRGNDPHPVKSPVAVHYELKNRGGDLLEVPMLRNLSDRPRVGVEDVEGHEEEMKVNFLQVPVEEMRHGVIVRYKGMDDQRMKDFGLLQKAEPLLQRHYARSMNLLQLTYAMYYGYSWHVLFSDDWSGHAKVSAKMHPHIYLSGRGKVGYGDGYPGTSGYEALCSTELNAMAGSDDMNTQFLAGIKGSPEIKKIPKIIMKDGNEMWLLILHPWQIASLENDDTFKTTMAQTMAQSYAKENPLLVGCKYIWEGFAIFENEAAVWPVRDSGGTTLQFGPSTFTHSAVTGTLDSFESYAGETMFAGYILGENALALAMASKIAFGYGTKDYNAKYGVAYKQISGAARADYWNREEGTTGQYLINESSALVISKAPQPSYA